MGNPTRNLAGQVPHLRVRECLGTVASLDRPLRNMTAVCGNIRRGWAGIERPPDFDKALAVYR